MGIFNTFKNKSKQHQLFDSNDWKERELQTEVFNKYQKELDPIAKKYYKQLQEEIKPGWSQLFKSK